MSLYGRALGWMDRIAGRGQGPKESALMEALEPRVLLDASFPDISDLVDPENTVVRFKTTLGEIDFELYDRSGPGGASAAPVTVENFLNYVNSGRYFESFFHRSVNVNSTNPDIDGDPFIIQGGGFIFNDDDGLSRVDTDDAIENEVKKGQEEVEQRTKQKTGKGTGNRGRNANKEKEQEKGKKNKNKKKKENKVR
eukprot:TRINITY_DN13155_c0_g1_i7.p3 TRINITY_DN13155_c0_g1~~TRINITY_DN13155_c0_g1_i7.p3  ORF type:complete len:196 (-),score=38.55 TRINITY_DN13155_c0_g1_i7:39-626(-)